MVSQKCCQSFLADVWQLAIVILICFYLDQGQLPMCLFAIYLCQSVFSIIYPFFFNFYIEIIIGSYRQLLREHKVIPFTLTHSPPMAVTNVSMVQHQNQKINIGVTCVYVCGSVRLYNMCGFVATTTMIKAQYHFISTTISLFPSAIANPCSSRICCLCL